MLHDAVEVGGGDLEERADVGAFDQERSSLRPRPRILGFLMVFYGFLVMESF